MSDYPKITNQRVLVTEKVFTIGLRGFKAIYIGDFVRWRFVGVRLRFAGITDGDRRRFVERFEQGVQNVVELILCVHDVLFLRLVQVNHGSRQKVEVFMKSLTKFNILSRFMNRYTPLLHAFSTVPSGSYQGLIMVCSCSTYSGVMGE